MIAQFSMGSSSQPSFAPLAMYSSIFSCTSGSRSDGERSSRTKSGQISVNFSFSSFINRFHRLFGIQHASGDRFAPLGNVSSDEESKQYPLPSCSAQLKSRALIVAFFRPVSILVGD